MKPLKLGKLKLILQFDFTERRLKEKEIIRIKAWTAYINGVNVGEISKWYRGPNRFEFQVRLYKFFCEPDVQEYSWRADGKREWSRQTMDMKEYNGFENIKDAGKAMKKLILKNILIVMAP